MGIDSHAQRYQTVRLARANEIVISGTGQDALGARCCVVMAVGMELERVRRTKGGRIHLTPRVPESGPVVTLCGQTFAEATYQATSVEADCRNCVRRSSDPGRVSSAFFQSDVGADLLQRSVEEARARRREQPAPPATTPAPAPSPTLPQPTPRSPHPTTAIPRGPRERGEGGLSGVPTVRGLRSRTPLRRTFENVYVSPEGVIVRVSGDEVSHVAFEGPVDLRRRDGVLTLRVGDVVLEFDERAPGQSIA